MKLEYLIYYFAFINLVGIIVNIADKIKAKHNKWRIRESTLWIIGILGGATGSYITMLLIRHKTKHKSFMLGMPVLALLNIAMLIYLFKICL
ncbi:MAG: DUF1294 domain-containing protein [Ruminococcaceae bacterium]|nr:DUF1294 domain-containing protein [Oscillospiraceae bacterium]